MGPSFSSHIFGLKELQAAFVQVGKEVDQAAHATVQEATRLFIATSKSNFEGSHSRGQPHEGGDKPNIVSGHLRQSIRAAPIEHIGMGEYGTTAGPSMIYARRVELGFKGPDELGRMFPNSRGYPFIKPAEEILQERLPGIAAGNWTKYVM